jgi:hypothetical protein
MPGCSRLGMEAIIRSEADTAEAMRDTLLPAFRKPIKPPTSNKTT